MLKIVLLGVLALVGAAIVYVVLVITSF